MRKFKLAIACTIVGAAITSYLWFIIWVLGWVGVAALVGSSALIWAIFTLVEGT